MTKMRDFEPGDAAAIASWVRDAHEMVLWSGKCGFTWPLDGGQILRFYERDSRRAWTLTCDGGEPVGHITLRTDTPGWTGRVGLVIVDPAERGKGHAEAMVRHVVDHAFGELGLHRVELGVYVQNAGAIRVYERLGFVREGLAREVAHAGGEWWSAYEMSVLAGEWKSPAAGR
ncbi:GNAT family N-acetyltransferase [Bailinhaonella thermotolerans]|uniref:N-acetyltransferase n=1 Tax=Bailinhaonella thermotolerans TaxID=1070861 RepID=A0A3A4B5B6_9ACTN|nr:GNAT family protein [Bailinhaonella thermotolerans]RJL33527.1 N-acetyltransferase [Bailinhaonella thermotolerans]